jgi:integrase
MPVAKLTLRTIEASKPAAVRFTIWDSEVRGFGLRMTPKGERTYVVRYRARGRLRWYTIGRHGSPWTPDEARRDALRVLGRVAEGDDPAASKQADRDSESLSEFAMRYIDEQARTKNKPRTVTDYKDLLERLIIPNLGAIKVTNLVRSDVARWHHGQRDRPISANRALAFLSKLMNTAEKLGLRPDGSNPCRHVDRFPERSRERFLSHDEFEHLGSALFALEGEGKILASAGAAIRLLVLTGCRLSEILGLRWEHVDFDHACLRLPDSKTGAKIVSLGAPALAILTAIPKLESGWVIPGWKLGAPLVNLHVPWAKVRKRAGIADVRLHDLRHSFAAVGASAGLGLPIIGRLLGHTQAATTQRYAHVSTDPVKRAADRIAHTIDAAMRGERGNVIALRGGTDSGVGS